MAPVHAVVIRTVATEVARQAVRLAADEIRQRRKKKKAKAPRSVSGRLRRR